MRFAKLYTAIVAFVLPPGGRSRSTGFRTKTKGSPLDVEKPILAELVVALRDVELVEGAAVLLWDVYSVTRTPIDTTKTSDKAARRTILLFNQSTSNGFCDTSVHRGGNGR